MSGHSKWATIHRQKEANDSKRGAAFTKLANAITIAVREGGGIGDPEANFKLRLAMDKARSANMPKDNIQRAIDRGTGAAGGVNFEEIMLEGFGPGGTAVMVQVVTDNRLRSLGEVKSVFDRGGGSMGSAGSVSYMFEKRGFVLVSTQGISNIDEAILKIMDLPVESVDSTDEGIEIFCQPASLYEVKKAIEQLGFAVSEAELIMYPKVTVSVELGTVDRVHSLLLKLEDLDDVQKVYVNAEPVG